ncbi:hypothetical protein, partial [Salmonella enterica]|uniref:hypothetical protein n=1 Tax=Salmonella enterica TaxID=28901 RepID=UPI003D2B40CE
LAGLTNPTGVAYDPNTPDDFYLLCTSGGAEKILEINKLSGANVANWTIPAGIATADRTGFSIEPYNGTFIIMKNNVSGSNPNKLI